jgi:hypothetical protein
MCKLISSPSVAAVCAASLMLAATGANAQYLGQPGWMQPLPPVMYPGITAPPVMLPPVMRPGVSPSATMPLRQQGQVPAATMPNIDPCRIIAPYAGAATTSTLSGYTSPAVGTWAGSRVNENWKSACREQNAVDATVRGFTGISPRDIQQYGWRGGPNSEVNKVLGIFGF